MERGASFWTNENFGFISQKILVFTITRDPDPIKFFSLHIFFELQNRTNGVNGIRILIFSCIFIVHKLIGRSNAYQYHLQIYSYGVVYYYRMVHSSHRDVIFLIVIFMENQNSLKL